ncbi:putative secreted protein (Por secretion system target) [Jejuia pallidilutea]|uniref:Putative secreted protein (Por secretion system target) n=1 Tax=Jejuia pallidilutea TaxID=504487 RepID=A0A362XE15_9FLAO|nr:Ig-like domain-containing protein [Jejuia pallidilutea]PQV51490.1 putative secreted protein (Por secretion system target) [Jejuia pallidilutea]
MEKISNFIIYSFLVPIVLITINTVSAQTVLPDVSNVNGAYIDESGISNIIYVRQNGGNNANSGKSYNDAKKTITAAFDVALNDLDAGIKTKILIHPGIYRESLGTVDFSLNNNRRHTPLVIEGTNEAQVVWSGADEYAPNTWTNLGNGVYRHNWSYDFGNYTPTFGPKAEVAVRRELVVVNGNMMRQIPLERYNITGGGNFFGNIEPISYEYYGFDDPATSLSDFSFGVAEKDENGNYIYVKVPSGFDWSSANIEVATRYTLGKFEKKNGLVFRKITFKNCANNHDDFGNVGALRFGDSYKCINIKFENCTFTQNSANGLKPNGSHWTLRSCKFNYNGNNGISSSVSKNLLIENCEFNFNNWRGYAFGDRKGGISWYLAGAKIHDCDGVIVRSSKAIGNHSNGLWYDVHVKDVLTDNFISLYNRHGLAIELSNGPYLINRSILAYQLNNPLNYSIIGDANLTNSILLSNSTQRGNNGRDGAALAIQWYDRTDNHASKELVLAKPFITENNIIVKENSTDPGQTIFQDIWPSGSKTENYEYKGIENIYYGAKSSTAFHSSGYGFNPGGDGDLDWWKTAWKVESDNSTWQDPKIADAPNGDFTFENASPVKPKEYYFPQYKLPEAVANEINDFFTWTTWNDKTGSIPSGFTGNIAPSVAIDFETLYHDQIVESDTDLNIKVAAYDDDGTISQVEFYDGATLLGTDSSAPYEYIWVSPPIGTNSITAKAIDNSGASSSHRVTFEVVDSSLSTGSIKPLNDSLKIIPNPTSYNVEILTEARILEIKIVNLTGKTLLYKDYLEGVKKPILDVSELQTGLYLVVARTNSGVTTKKLIVNSK